MIAHAEPLCHYDIIVLLPALINILIHNCIYILWFLLLWLLLSDFCSDKKMKQDTSCCLRAVNQHLFKKKKKTEEGERVELTLSCSVKLLTECVGDIVPECVENIRLTILWWRVKWNSLITRHQCRPFKMKMNKKCLNCTKIKRKLFFLLLNN